MVRVVDGDNHVVSTDLCGGNSLGPENSNRDPRSPSPGPQSPLRTQLVLLDFGLAEELTPEVRIHFISVLNSICSGKLFICFVYAFQLFLEERRG